MESSVCLIYLYFVVIALSDCYVVFNITSGGEPRSLEDAIKDCRSQNASVARALDLSANHSALTVNTSYWSGSTQAPWISFEGCFKQIGNTSDEEQTLEEEHRTMDNMSYPAMCQRQTNCTEYFGIQNDKCICTNVSDAGVWGRQEDSQCGSLWRGSTSDHERYFTFYKTLNMEYASNIPQGRACLQASLVTKAGGKRVLTHYSLSCSKSIQILCSDDNKLIQNSWELAVDQCWQTGKFPKEYFTDYAEVGPSISNWIGTFRGLSPLPDEDTEQDVCFKMVLEDDDVTETVTSCDGDDMDFFCISEVEEETEATTLTFSYNQTTVDASTTVTDTSAMSTTFTTLPTGTTTPPSTDQGAAKYSSGDTGVYAGIGAGVVVLSGLLIISICAYKRKRRKKDNSIIRLQDVKKGDYSYSTATKGVHYEDVDRVYSDTDGMHVAPQEDANTYGVLHGDRSGANDNDNLYDHAKVLSAGEGDYDTFAKLPTDTGDNIYDHTTSKQQSADN